jgi:O-antigen/teichoic acid export membrane protein
MRACAQGSGGGRETMRSAVLRGSFTLGIADFSRKVLLAATVLLCTRFLSPETFGDYVLLLSFYQIFAVLGGSGIPSALLRSVARNHQSGIRVALASGLARLAYIVPTAGLMYVAMRLLGFSTRYFSAIGLLALMMLVRGAAENVTFIFQGAEDQISCAKVGVTQSAVTLLVTLAVCLTSKNLLLLLAAHVVGGFASAAYGFVLLRIKVRPDPDKELGTVLGKARCLLQESHWLNAGSFVACAYNRVDVLLLRRILTSAAVAVYGAPYRILDLTQIVPSSVMATLLPGLCRNGNINSSSVHPRTVLRFLLIIAFGLIVTVTVAARWITLLLFGAQYSSSAPVLQILIWVTIPMFWNLVLNAQLIAYSFDRAILQAASAALIVNVGLNLLLIPKFGYLACAGVTLVTECTLLAANLHFVSAVNATGVPERLGRLSLTTGLLGAFCLCWCLTGSKYLLLEAALLFMGVLALPLFRSDLSQAAALPEGAVGSGAKSVRETPLAAER